jgi:cystathionine gamma-synthase
MARSKKLPGSTEAIHAGVPPKRPHGVLAPGIAQTATYRFGASAELDRYMRGEDPDPDRVEYGRYGNPTVRELERRLAALEGTDDALAFSTGMAAITTAILALTRAGDHVVLFRDCYRRTRQFVGQVLARFGVTCSLCEPGDLDGLAAALTDRTRLVVSESPTNPYLFCVDLERLVEIARARGRLRVLVDATLATPVQCRPAEYGVDLVVHSATKYLAGHNDVLGGAVCGPAQLLSLVKDARDVLGGTLDPHAAFLVARGLKTLALRVERQSATALALARALEAHRAVERVWYPLLESHPSHAVAQRQMRGGGGLVSFAVRGGREAAARVVDGCRLASIASSLGGVETLVEQPALMSYFELDDAGLAEVGILPGLIRIAVGCEETDDVVRDVIEALDALG